MFVWQAGRNFPKDFPIESIYQMMGVLPQSSENRLPVKEDVVVSVQDIPENFDAREQWPDCPTVGEIRDQASCGSCWVSFALSVIFGSRKCEPLIQLNLHLFIAYRLLELLKPCRTVFAFTLMVK